MREHVNRITGAMCLVLAVALVSERMWADSPRRERERMIGLLRVPAIVRDEEPPWTHLSRSLSLRVEPSSSATIARVITRPDELVLEGKTSDFAIAYDRQGGWFLIRYRTSANKSALAWLAPEDVGEFRHLIDLYSRGLINMTKTWDRRLYRRPAIGSESEIVKTDEKTDGGEPAAEFVKFANVDGDLWWLVVIVGPGRCTNEHGQEPVIAAGWVPAYGAQGQPNVWYSSEC